MWRTQWSMRCCTRPERTGGGIRRKRKLLLEPLGACGAQIKNKEKKMKQRERIWRSSDCRALPDAAADAGAAAFGSGGRRSVGCPQQRQQP
ncbi:hypothetical protein AAVH_13059 [Aphelenchoides avenae]|nr:hypothetical protein AAVH_13059 [Aphelenchus avenae]